MKKKVLLITIPAVLLIATIVLVIVLITSPKNEIINISIPNFENADTLILGQAKATKGSSDPFHLSYHFKEETDYEAFIEYNLEDSEYLFDKVIGETSTYYILQKDNYLYYAETKDKFDCITVKPLITYLEYKTFGLVAPLFIESLDSDDYNFFLKFDEYNFYKNL